MSNLHIDIVIPVDLWFFSDFLFDTLEMQYKIVSAVNIGPYSHIKNVKNVWGYYEIICN